MDGSPAGAKLRVKGTCVRPTTISRDIKVVGKSGHGFGRATLDGDHRGSVLTIQGGTTVTLRGLLITNGVAPSGGGIHVRGSMTLIDTVVSGNTATGEGGEQGGGGVGIDSGTITLVDSIVRNNTAAADGGGIYVGLLPGGDLSIHGTSSVRGNHAGRTGGGIYVDHFSRFSIYDFSSIDHNSAGQRGGGVKCADCGVVALNGDASIHHNTADVAGGGIESRGTGAPLHLRDRSSIHDNTAPDGGGAWLLGSSLDMSGTSSIYHNTAAADGGGAYLSEGSLLEVGAMALNLRELGDQRRRHLPGAVDPRHAIRDRLRDSQRARQLLPIRGGCGLHAVVTATSCTEMRLCGCAPRRASPGSRRLAPCADC